MASVFRSVRVLLGHAFPVSQELLDAGVGQGVLGQLEHDRIGDGGDVGADQGRVEHVNRVAYAGDDDLAGVAVVVGLLKSSPISITSLKNFITP